MNMKKTFLAVVLMAAASGAAAQGYEMEIPLWPDGPAESNGLTGPEVRNSDWSVTNVSEAAIYVWPAQGTPNGQAMLICPGGGYSGQAANHEGIQWAEWFALKGITAIVLKYRLPNGHSEIPLADTQQAMRVIRERAKEWAVDPAKVGVMGFSAGGHLASTLLTHFDAESRPDFGILFYPVVTMTDSTHGGSRRNLLGENPSPELIERFSNERQVTPETPPTMILFSDDDTAVPPVNGTAFYDALKACGIPAAMHIYPVGGHGWGFRKEFRYHDAMIAAVEDWLGRF
jgi:acetyl esterase/lipase